MRIYKNKIPKLIYIIFGFIVLSNCSGEIVHIDEYPSVMINNTDFKEVLNLESKKVNEVNNHTVYPSFIHVADSVLVVVERELQEEFIKFFSLNDFKFLGSYGKRGEGPGEFSDILQHVVQIQDSSEVKFINVFDWEKKHLFKLHSFNSSEDLKIHSTYILPPELMLTQRATFLNDSIVAGMGGIHEGILYFVNTETDYVAYIPFIPPLIEDEMPIQDIINLYRGEFAIDKRLNRIAFATKWFPEVIVSDFNGNIQQVTRFLLPDHPAKNPENERILYYKDIKITGNYIYAVYLGLSYNEMGKIYENYNDDNNISTEIHVFDWNGNPVRRLILNDKFVQFISVNSSANQIFALDTFSNDISLLLFESDVIE